MHNKLSIIFLSIVFISCTHQEKQLTPVFEDCKNTSSFNLQAYQAPSNLFQIDLPSDWLRDIDFDSEYFSLFVIDTSQTNLVNTIGINVKKTDRKIDNLFFSEMKEMKNEFEIIKIGENLVFNDDRWILNKERINNCEVINLLIYRVVANKLYIIHLTSSITNDDLNHLYKYLPILQSIDIEPSDKITT